MPICSTAIGSRVS